MIYIPSVIKDIIYNYKQELEYEDNKKNHEKKFINTLYLIKKFRNMTFERRNHGSMGNSNRRTITIGPMNKNNHTFDDWMDYIIDPASANIRYQDEYKGQVTVLMFSQYNDTMSSDQAIMGAKYLEAFPTNVDPITLGWDQSNQVGKFSVNFQYKKWIDGSQREFSPSD